MARIWIGAEQKLWTVVLLLGSSTVYAARTALPLCIPIIAKQLGWTKQQSGLVLSTFFCGYAVTQIIGGYMADRVGGEIVIMLAALVWSLATLLTPFVLQWYPHASDPPFIMFTILSLRFIMGAAQGVHYPSVSSITSKHCKDDERSLIYGTICAGSHVGTLIAGSIGSYVLAHFGWTYVFYMIGCLGLSWSCALHWMMRKYNSPNPFTSSTNVDVKGQQRVTFDMVQNTKDQSESLLPPPAAVGVEQTSPAVISSDTARPPWKVLFTSAAFWSIIVGHFCENYAFFILLSWLPSYFHDEFPHAKGWVYNVVPWVAVFPMCVLGGYFANKMIAAKVNKTFVRKSIETVALLGCAFFLILLQYTYTFTSALFCLTTAVAVNGFHNSGILVNPQDIAPKYAGSVFGVMNMAGALPGFFGVYLAGWMLTPPAGSGSGGSEWSGVFSVTSAVLCVGWLAFTMFGTGRQIV